MDGHVKDMFGSMDNIYDNNNIRNILYLECLTNAISNSKKWYKIRV